MDVLWREKEFQEDYERDIQAAIEKVNARWREKHGHKDRVTVPAVPSPSSDGTCRIEDVNHERPHYYRTGEEFQKDYEREAAVEKMNAMLREKDRVAPPVVRSPSSDGICRTEDVNHERPHYYCPEEEFQAAMEKVDALWREKEFQEDRERDIQTVIEKVDALWREKESQKDRRRDIQTAIEKVDALWREKRGHKDRYRLAGRAPSPMRIYDIQAAKAQDDAIWGEEHGHKDRCRPAGRAPRPIRICKHDDVYHERPQYYCTEKEFQEDCERDLQAAIEKKDAFWREKNGYKGRYIRPPRVPRPMLPERSLSPPPSDTRPWQLRTFGKPGGPSRSYVFRKMGRRVDKGPPPAQHLESGHGRVSTPEESYDSKEKDR